MKSTYQLLVLFVSFLSFSACAEMNEDEKVYRFNKSLNVDGISRTYILNLPPGYYNDAAQRSLVIGLHGGGGSGSQFEEHYGFTKKADKAGFIVVYPDGVQSSGILGLRTWNAGKCCDYAMEKNIDDVKFIRNLIDELIAHYKINPKKVYVTGMSNGAMLAYRLACEIPEKIAAIAPVSGTMNLSGTCQSSRSMPVLHLHSVLDERVPYEGGVGIAGYYYPPVEDGLKFWASKAGCSLNKQTENRQGYRHIIWPDCKDKISVEYYLTDDGGHSWPGSVQVRKQADPPSEVINANDLIWDFFQRFELP